MENSRTTLTYGTDDVSPRLTRKKLFVVACILMTEFCERLTYFSVVANLILFCTSTLHLSSPDAARISLVFSGLVLLPASAINYEEWFGNEYSVSTKTRRGFFFSALVLVGIGTGGLKANVGPFGAKQVEYLGPKAIQSFFNWFYWFVNASAIVAYTGVATVQQNVGFDVGFIIPLLSMIIAILIFVINRQSYVFTPPGGSVIKDSIGVCCATRCKGFNHAREDNGGPYNDKMVDGVISVLRILPVFLLVIMYWAILSQMSTTYYIQSERMNIKVGQGNVPVTVVQLFDILIVIVLIPFMESVVYPFLKRRNRSPSHLQRIGIGMIFAALSVFVAGILEIYRKKDISIINQKLAGKSFNASSLSIFAQVPQFTLAGTSEVFTSITGLEFAYSQSPEFMRGTTMGLFLATTGIGHYVAELLIEIVVAATGSKPPNSWFPDEINDGKTEYLFFLLGILMIVNFLVFAIVAKMYKTYSINGPSNDTPPNETVINEDSEHDLNSNNGKHEFSSKL